MKTPKELLEQCLATKTRIKNSHSVIASIDAVIKTLKELPVDKWTPLLVENSMTKLTIYMIELGELANYYAARSDTKYIYRKFSRIDAYKSLRESKLSKLSIKDAELYSEKQVEEEVVAEEEAKFIAGVMQTYYEDVSRLIMVLQSRMKSLNSDMGRAGL